MPRIRYSNCPCPGRWKHKLTRWVCLKRMGECGFLKCLECGWKWKSKRKYVAQLPDHVERSRSGLTDSDILKRLRDGNLRIDPVTCVVESNLTGVWRELTPVIVDNGSGYQMVSVCYQGRKKKIGIHRLQWMQHTLELIPEGYDVDHIESPPRPKLKPNHLSNLRLRDSYENQCDNVCPGMGVGSDVPF